MTTSSQGTLGAKYPRAYITRGAQEVKAVIRDGLKTPLRQLHHKASLLNQPRSGGRNLLG
jgi:hypothetical protein